MIVPILTGQIGQVESGDKVYDVRWQAEAPGIFDAFVCEVEEGVERSGEWVWLFEEDISSEAEAEILRRVGQAVEDVFSELSF